MPNPLDDIPGFLRGVEIFSDLSDDELRRVAAIAEARRVPSGEAIFTEGDRGDAMFVVVFGQVAIEREAADGERVTLGTVGPRQVFGEMALFEDVSRSATARASGASAAVLAIGREVFVDLLRASPEIALRMLAQQGRRLRQLNDRVVMTDLEVRRNAPTLLETVIAEYPHPIALMFQELDAASSASQRLHRSFELFEVIARSLVALAAGAYLAQPHYDAEVDRGLVDLQRGMTLGPMVRFVRAVATHLSERRPTPGLGPDLHAWITGRQPGRPRVAEAIDAVLECRNTLKHGAEAALDPDEVQALLDGVTPRVELLVKTLGFLTEYPWVYVDGMNYDDGVFTYRAQVCRGAFRSFRSEALTHPRAFDTQRLYAHDRARNALLPLSPFAGLHRCAVCGDREVFLLNNGWSARKVELVEFGRGHRLTQREVPASVGALERAIKSRLGLVPAEG